MNIASPVTLSQISATDSMNEYIEWVLNCSTLVPKVIFEIGANLAQDAKQLAAGFGLDDLSVWVFEPHPELCSIIRSDTNFNAFQVAISNYDGYSNLRAVSLNDAANHGISSLRNRTTFSQEEFIDIRVPVYRMDTFIKNYGIKSIDFLKIDVEGSTLEVLEGFGDHIDRVVSLHVESEHMEHWDGQKLWPDVREFLEKHFELVLFRRNFTQSDSFWIKKTHIRSGV